MDANNLVVVSDLHCGCRLGLCHPGAVPLDDGGTYRASPLQRKIWAMWTEFWRGWVPSVCRNEKFAVVVNGDAIDGVHHKSTTQISHNLEDQADIANVCLEPVVAAAKGGFYMIRGTEAHGGSSGVHEEALAKRLGAIPDKTGRHARYELWKRVGDCLAHLMHHIGSTSSSAHEASAVNAELAAEYVEAARWRKEPPDYVIRSHRHRSIAVDLDGANGYAAAIVTPGWQAKTPFTFKIAGARISTPQFGGILIRQGNEEHYYRRKVWPIGRPEVE